MKKKIGSLTIKITVKYLLLRTTNYILFGISWINPWRLMIIAHCSEEGLLGPALFNFGLTFGQLLRMDATGVDLRLEVFGKGFTYRKFRYCEMPNIPPRKQFEIIK